MSVDIQSLFVYNPKTREYLIRIGNLCFPFKTIEEVYAYFLGKLKLGGRLKSKLLRHDTVSNNSFFIKLSKLILYLTSYCKKTLIHFNRFREVLH
jgi:hypothetical protein